MASRGQGFTTGMPHTSLRYFNVVGSGTSDLYDTSPHNLFPRVLDALVAGRTRLLDEIATDAPTSDLGPLRPGENREEARAVVEQLISMALDVCRLLVERLAGDAEIACLTRVEYRLAAARTKISGLGR